MPNPPLSLDFRLGFERYVSGGLSGREPARRLMISPATASRLVQKIARGESLAPARYGRKQGKGKLAPHRGF